MAQVPGDTTTAVAMGQQTVTSLLEDMIYVLDKSDLMVIHRVVHPVSRAIALADKPRLHRLLRQAARHQRPNRNPGRRRIVRTIKATVLGDHSHPNSNRMVLGTKGRNSNTRNKMDNIPMGTSL